MQVFEKKYTMRWNDLDANRHVANATYAALMNDTRMSFLMACGFGQPELASHGIGPVIFTEQFHYLKEIRGGEEVRIDLELLGATPDYRILLFAHRLFNPDGVESVYSTVQFGWFDLNTRKLVVPPAVLAAKLIDMPRADAFEELTRERLAEMRYTPPTTL